MNLLLTPKALLVPVLDAATRPGGRAATSRRPARWRAGSSSSHGRLGRHRRGDGQGGRSPRWRGAVRGAAPGGAPPSGQRDRCEGRLSARLRVRPHRPPRHRRVGRARPGRARPRGHAGQQRRVARSAVRWCTPTTGCTTSSAPWRSTTSRAVAADPGAAAPDAGTEVRPRRQHRHVGDAAQGAEVRGLHCLEDRAGHLLADRRSRDLCTTTSPSPTSDSTWCAPT